MRRPSVQSLGGLFRISAFREWLGDLAGARDESLDDRAQRAVLQRQDCNQPWPLEAAVDWRQKGAFQPIVDEDEAAN